MAASLEQSLAEISARLARIEAELKARPLAEQDAPSPLSYTPRQLAKRIGRSYRWVVDRCAAGVIPTTSKRAPYLIPAGAADAMFSKGKGIFG
jgi:hypothetical protein